MGAALGTDTGTGTKERILGPDKKMFFIKEKLGRYFTQTLATTPLPNVNKDATDRLKMQCVSPKSPLSKNLSFKRYF